MAASPVQPPSPEQPQQANERFGPLTITRLHKDDGRSLILYGHDEQPDERDEQALAGERTASRERKGAAP